MVALCRIFPKNGSDEDALSLTETNLKNITQNPELWTYRNPVDNSLLMWMVNITETQLGEMRQLEGLRGIEENSKGAIQLEAALPLTSPSAIISDGIASKIESNLESVTQTSVSTDLVSASQPTYVQLAPN